MSLYDDDFYKVQSDGSRYAASEILPLLFSIIEKPKSVIDIGCGVGGWLAECKKKGVDKIVGIDGEYVNKDLLFIPSDDFIPCNLTDDFMAKVDQKFDMAMTLEVAEHLPAEYADVFVESLTRLSEVIFFSAAIPHQGGTFHVNEQWPEYWAEKFKKHDYYPLDVIRPKIWDHPKIVAHYKQNIILFIHKDTLLKLVPEYDFEKKQNLKALHPELALQVFKRGHNDNLKMKVLKSSVHILSSIVPFKEKRKETRRVLYKKMGECLFPELCKYQDREVLYKV